MTNDLKWLFVSDLQIPYQDDRAVKLWFDVMKWFKPDIIDILGDVSDQFCFAGFEEGTTSEFLKSLPAETRTEDTLEFLLKQESEAKAFYEKTRKMRPNAEIFSALGNHDIRIWRYADKKLPDLLPVITPNSLWGLDNLGIDYIYYDEVPKKRHGDIYVHHGISALGESGASIKSDMLAYNVSLVRGHSHRLGTYYKTYELTGTQLRGYEIGHMSKVDSDGFKYTQIHNWQQGFAIGHIHGDNVYINLIEIAQDYTCVVDGKLFSA